MAALRFDVGRSFAVVGNVLVLGFVLGKISAILGKISAILGKLGPSGRLGLVLGASWGRLGPLERQVGALDGKLGSSGHLGRILKPSWAVLGATWAAIWGQVAILGTSWAHLGAVLVSLGRQVEAKWPSWARLGRILGPSRAVLDAILAPRWNPKSIQKSIKSLKLFQDRFLELHRSFGSQLVRILGHLGHLEFQIKNT